jgi:endoglucanase
MLMKIAQEKGIPYQLAGASGATGTDANVIQLSRAGVATALMSVPVRYMHTPVEVLSLKDLEAAVKLLSAFVLEMKEGMSFIP